MALYYFKWYPPSQLWITFQDEWSSVVYCDLTAEEFAEKKIIEKLKQNKIRDSWNKHRGCHRWYKDFMVIAIEVK